MMMEERQVQSAIELRKSDLLRLRWVLATRQRIGLYADDYELLREEIDRARIVDDDALASTVVAIGSTAIVLDPGSGEYGKYTLVLPPQGDIARLRVSVLAPLGTALLGSSVGDVIEWQMSGGSRRLRIEAVRHGKEANGLSVPAASSMQRILRSR
ncbi:GreA/GreB family elongation factor [Povalibacter sp.]|uniref:GreA/GreB family elongation factor n=1 Tax=Povalibacter sp. TaxID=1962978 RepID=UPI002F418E82